MHKVAHGAEVRRAGLARLVAAFHRHGDDRRAQPGRAHHEFQLVGVAIRPDHQLLHQRERITAKAALGVAQPHARLDAIPERGDRIRAPPMRRATRFAKISHADEIGFRLLLGLREKLRQVFREMLAIRVHRDGVREAKLRRAAKARLQRPRLAAVLLQPNHIAPRQLRQRLRRAIIHHDHRCMRQRRLRHRAHGRGVVVAGNENAGLHAWERWPLAGEFLKTNGVLAGLNTPFPLTLTLSPGEREQRLETL